MNKLSIEEIKEVKKNAGLDNELIKNIISIKHPKINSKEWINSFTSYVKQFYGISTETEKGRKYFGEIVVPDMKNYISGIKNEDTNQGIGSTIDYIREGVKINSGNMMMNGFANLSRLFKNGEISQKEDYKIRGSFVEDLEKLKENISKKEYGKARFQLINYDSKIKKELSDLEVIAGKKFHFCARRIYFMQETHNQPSELDISFSSYVLEKNLKRFIKIAKDKNKLEEQEGFLKNTKINSKIKKLLKIILFEPSF